MALHPKIRAGLDRLKHLPCMDQLSPEAAREQMRSVARAIRRSVSAPAIGSVAERELPAAAGSLRVRIFSPEGPGPFPLVHFIHGGGFVLGDLDSYNHICRTICGRVGAVVVAPDYRLAPEHRYPSAVEDCVAAIRWSQTSASALNADAARTALAGDSAGGNLATVCAHRLRREIPLCAQLLVYPVTDHYSSAHASYSAYADGYGLTDDEMRWFWDHYVVDAAAAEQESVSPLRAADVSGLPQTLVIAAEYDVLRDEGERYAERLIAAGNSVECRLATGMNHGFWMLAGALPEADESLHGACAWLRARLEASPANKQAEASGRT